MAYVILFFLMYVDKRFFEMEGGACKMRRF